MGSSTGRDYTKHVNESNVGSVTEQENKGRDAERESFRLYPDVRASNADGSAKLQTVESGEHPRIKLNQQPQDNGQLNKMKSHVR